VGTPAVVNRIPIVAGPHLAFLADRLGLSLKVIRGIHGSAGFMSAVLVLHAMVAVSNASLPLDIPPEFVCSNCVSPTALIKP
jgi:hypothetical protein